MKNEEKYIIGISDFIYIMVFEGLKEILDIENLINKYGRFAPVFFFMYSAYKQPSNFNFIWLISSLLVTISIPKFRGTISKYYKNDGEAKFKTIANERKKLKFYTILFIGLIYMFLMFFVGFLLLIRIIDMIKNTRADIILIIISIITYGTLFNIIFGWASKFKKTSKQTFK